MTIVSLDQTSLDELDRAVAEKELRETPAIKQAAIQELRQLLAGEYFKFNLRVKIYISIRTIRFAVPK